MCTQLTASSDIIKLVGPLTNSKIPKGLTKIVKSEDKQDHGQQYKTEDKHRKNDITLKPKAKVIRTLKTKQGESRCS